MDIKEAVLISSLGIALLSIEWKAWKTHLLKNIILSVFFLFALYFGRKDIKEQKSKEAQDNKDIAYLRRSADSANGQLNITTKDLQTIQETDSSIYLALNKTKLYYDDKSKAIKPQYGFKSELLGIYTKPQKIEDNTKSQPPVTITQTTPQSKNPLTQWYIKHWTAQIQKARTSYDKDSATLHNVSEYHTWRLPSTRKQEINDASIALEQDRTNIKNYKDSLSYWQNHK
jgi:hypothetical protein